MGNGGFLIKFDGNEVKRGYAVSVDYDAWTFTINNDDPKPIPKGVKEITVSVEK